MNNKYLGNKEKSLRNYLVVRTAKRLAIIYILDTYFNVWTIKLLLLILIKYMGTGTKY